MERTPAFPRSFIRTFLPRYVTRFERVPRVKRIEAESKRETRERGREKKGAKYSKHLTRSIRGTRGTRVNRAAFPESVPFLGLSAKDVVITRRYTDEPAFSSGCNLFEATL